MHKIRFLLIPLFAGVALIASSDSADANHRVRWTAVADYDDPPGFWGESYDTTAVYNWAIGGGSTRVVHELQRN